MGRQMQVWKFSAVACAVVLAGCSDATSSLVGRGQQMSLSLATRGAAPLLAVSGTGAVRVAGDTLVVAAGSDTLRITSVELVLRKIELNRATTPVNCDSTSSADACEEFELGPRLVSLPLGYGAVSVLDVPIDSGTYDKVEFVIHKPGGDSLDMQFKAAHPEFANISIRVRGTFNGTPFTYSTPMDQEQEITFVPPLVVDASGSSANLTIRMDVSTWFRVGGTGALIAPASANVGQPNEGAVRENIKNSIEAYEDPDRDGDEN
jgi:hypothetical protein